MTEMNQDVRKILLRSMLTTFPLSLNLRRAQTAPEPSSKRHIEVELEMLKDKNRSQQQTRCPNSHSHIPPSKDPQPN